jgi:hypothetical protein
MLMLMICGKPSDMCMAVLCRSLIKRVLIFDVVLCSLPRLSSVPDQLESEL